MKRVLISTSYLHPGCSTDLKLRDAGFDTVFKPHLDRLDAAELGSLFADVDAVIAGTDRFSESVIDAAPRVKIIARTGVGYDRVDVAAASGRGIAVTATPGVNGVAVAELTVALMLSCARHIPQSVASVRRQEWTQQSGRELSGTTLGVVGFGSVGKLVAKIAQGLGMTVMVADPLVPTDVITGAGAIAAGLDELLAASDFVSLHIFLDDSTRNLINKETLATMKPGSVLINTARGEIVDEDALLDAIASGHLTAAGLDVVHDEPLPRGSRLREFENIVITPHVAGATVEARERSSMMAAEQVIDHLSGRVALHVVNPEFQEASDRRAVRS